MPARGIGRWVGRAAMFVALGVGLLAVVGLTNAGGFGGSVVSGQAAFGDGFDSSDKQPEVTTMDFDWN